MLSRCHVELFTLQQSYSSTVSGTEIQPTSALEDIKTILSSVPTSDTDISIYGSCYFLSKETGKGHQWDKLPINLAKPNLAKICVDKFDSTFMNKVLYFGGR